MIYRGYDIKKNSEGRYGIHSAGSYPVIEETFDTEDDAMDFIDRQRRKTAGLEKSNDG